MLVVGEQLMVLVMAGKIGKIGAKIVATKAIFFNYVRILSGINILGIM